MTETYAEVIRLTEGWADRPVEEAERAVRKARSGR
jgi:hypothetical protein